MQILTQSEMFQLLCKSTGKWGVKVHLWIPEGNTFTKEQADGLQYCVPQISFKDYNQHWSDGIAFILCDSEEEMNHEYGKILGDDSPGPFGYTIYASTCGPDGEFITENT